MLEIKSENPGSLITQWSVWYWDGDEWKTDGQWHLIGASVYVPNGTNTVGCYTRDFWGNVSAFYMSQWFTPADDQTYIYNILNSTVTLEAEILFRNFQIESWTPDPAVLEEGDTFRAICKVEYIGAYSRGKVHLAIGKRGAVFDEILDAEVNISFPSQTTWTARYATVTINITNNIAIGEEYDVYAKLMSVPGPDLFDYEDNIVAIIGIPDAEFRNFRIHSYSPTTVRVGSTLRMVHRFEYQGPRYTSAHILAEIGNDIGGIMFSDFEKDQYISVGPAYTWQDYEVAVDISINAPKDSGYRDIKGSLQNVPGIDPSDKKLNVITFEGLGDSEFDTFRIVTFSPVQIKVGDTVNLSCSFRHRGKADPCRVYGAIGKRKPFIGFDEYYDDEKNVSTTNDYDWVTYNVALSIYINREVSDSVLDIYAKLDEIPGAVLFDERDGVLTFAQMGEAEFSGLAFGTISPTEVKPGDTVQMECIFQHRGAAYTEGFVYASIGKRKIIIGFDEYTHSEIPFQVEPDIDWTTYNIPIGVEVPVKDDETFDIYFKLRKVPGTEPLVEMEDALVNQEGPVTGDEFRNLAVDFEKTKPAVAA